MEMTTMVKVSPGNDKLGSIPNVSLLPIVTCDCRFPCAKRKNCYAWRFSRRPGVQKAWAHNTDLAMNQTTEFFRNLYYQLQAQQPRRFRWHVGGDCPSLEYVREVFNIAELCPETRFLIFSKRYKWITQVVDERNIPTNLSVKLSAWPGCKMHNPKNLPVAYMLDSRNPDPRIHTSVFPCLGTCKTCAVCWNQRDDVLFNKH